MTTDTEALKALLAKVEAASGPDRGLDADILCTLLAPAAAFVEQSPFNGEWCIYEAPASAQRPRPRLWEKPLAFRGDHASVTASIDAALALVERVLPREFQWAEVLREATGTLSNRHRWHCAFSRPSQLQELPLAIIGSLLTAALAQGGHHDA